MASRGVAALLIAVLAGCGDGTAQSGSASPMPSGSLSGWQRSFADGFSGAKLGAGWTTYSGQPSGDPAGWFDASHVSVVDGVLTLRGAYDGVRKKWVTGGISSRRNLVQTYGKYEVRFRAAKGKGIAYSMLLWPIDNSWPPEIDFAQDNGDQRDRVYASLHAIGGWQADHSKAGNFSEWHTAGVEWTPSRIGYTLDGKVWGTVRDSRVPDEPMALALQTQAWYCGHSWQRCPDSTTPTQVDLQVDWVVAYSRRSV